MYADFELEHNQRRNIDMTNQLTYDLIHRHEICIIPDSAIDRRLAKLSINFDDIPKLQKITPPKRHSKKVQQKQKRPKINKR